MASEVILARESSVNPINAQGRAVRLKSDGLPEGAHFHKMKVDGVYQGMIDLADRKIVLVNMNGVDMPFYLSTGMGRKYGVLSGKWYPFFGLDPDGWFNKGGEDDTGKTDLIPVVGRVDIVVRRVDSNGLVHQGGMGGNPDVVRQGIVAPVVGNGNPCGHFSSIQEMLYPVPVGQRAGCREVAFHALKIAAKAGHPVCIGTGEKTLERLAGLGKNPFPGRVKAAGDG